MQDLSAPQHECPLPALSADSDFHSPSSFCSLLPQEALPSMVTESDNPAYVDSSTLFYRASVDQSTGTPSQLSSTNVSVPMTQGSLFLGSNPSSLQQQQPALSAEDGSVAHIVQHVNTPVMHPNLVSTLKSIISPPLSPQALLDSTATREESQRFTQFEQFGFSQPFYHGLEPTELGRAPSGCCELVQYDVEAPPGSQSGMCSEDAKQVESLGNTKQVSTSRNQERAQAAVVPIDLIRNRRPFRCAYAGCNKTFKNPQTMKMHHKTHYTDATAVGLGAEAISSCMPTVCFKAGQNKKIPSRCPACKKTFVGLYELRRHFGRKHSEGEKSHACRKCRKRFHIEVDVRDHEKLCGESIICRCGMKFAFKCNLVAHKRGRPECQDNLIVEEEQCGASMRAAQQGLVADKYCEGKNGHDGAVKQEMQSSICFTSGINGQLQPAMHDSAPFQPLPFLSSLDPTSLPLNTAFLSSSVLQSLSGGSLASLSALPTTGFPNLTSAVVPPGSAMGHPIDQHHPSGLI